MISEDIKEAISKNLPQMVGEELKRQLERLESLESAHKMRGDTIDKQTKRIESLEKHNTDLLEENAMLAASCKREEELDKRELRLETELLKVQLASQIGQNNQFMELMKIVFKNPVFRESQVFNKSVPMMIPGQTYPTSFSETGSTTTTRENE